MPLNEKFKSCVKFLKITAVLGSGGLFLGYHINQTHKVMNRVVNSDVLDHEKKHTPEFIYIDDPGYDDTLKKEQDRERKHPVGMARIWKSLRHSVTWRLLWLCRHGTPEIRNVALVQLAAFKNNKDWDCLKLAQAIDKNTAVLLARTKGADLRYFLPPPLHIRRAALNRELLSFKFLDIITALQDIRPHSCISQFLTKHFSNVIEVDSFPAKRPNSMSEKNLCILCLDAIHHHLTLFHNNVFEEDHSTIAAIEKGILEKLAELLLRYKNDIDIDLAVLRIFTVLSVHKTLLTDFFINGLIRELSRLIHSKDVRLSSMAAACLTNLSGEGLYRPGLFLLHPLYRTTESHNCDILLVHGLRGGVFVTWRQRDKKCSAPVGIIEVTISDNDCDPCLEVEEEKSYLDPELQQVIDNLNERENINLLSEYDIVLQDVPIEARHDPPEWHSIIKHAKHLALTQEIVDKCNYTHCWPKDWLPKDCDKLRILGVNYWSSLSEWLERCPLQTADIETRASELAPSLLDAGVGKKNVPVVWLAHSMGGLIVKQLLVDSSKNTAEEYHNLCKLTKTLFFYSTPHKGSSLATMPRAAAAVLWPSSDVKQLQENSPVLLSLHENFIKNADIYKWETVSFAESMPTLITAFKVPVMFVESESADLGRGLFYKLPLDHLSICKPATRQSLLYITVLDAVRKATAKEYVMKYNNRFVQAFMDLIWWLVYRKENKLNIENKSCNTKEKLSWFEQAVFDAFTEDGFTD